MKILILGANGFIGTAIVTRLLSAGHELTGLGRDIGAAHERFPSVTWRRTDLANMQAADNWETILAGQDIVVNCAGALQDGLRDNLAASQAKSMLALYAAAKAKGNMLIVQISARTGGSLGALTFLATKARADEGLKASGLNHVILRPALVIGRNAHGGSALLRALAAFPFVTPLALATSPIATVALEDVATAVTMALDGDIPPSSDLDLAAPDLVTLEDLVALHRSWLGLGRKRTMALPNFVAWPVAWLADFAGWLGWRPPLRSTAMAVMAEGVRSGSSRPQMIFKDAAATLASQPAGVQDLWFARLYLLKPVAIVILALFWILSGVIPLFMMKAASAHFLPFIGDLGAIAVTIATSVIDIGLGLLTLWRPRTRQALTGQILLALCYLAGGTMLEPALWLDPLGPYVKVMPAIMLSLVTLAILDER